MGTQMETEKEMGFLMEKRSVMEMGILMEINLEILMGTQMEMEIMMGILMGMEKVMEMEMEKAMVKH